MTGNYKKRILFIILNWGLGHATRCIPLIKALTESHTITIASAGRSLDLLREEFPDLDCFESTDYEVRASKFKTWLIPSIGLQIPQILGRILEEKRLIKKLVREYKIDMIVSDSCYGAYSRLAPTFFITHQLRFPLPKSLHKTEFLSEWFNYFFFKKYKYIFVLDTRDRINLTGKLSHKGLVSRLDKLVYLGILSSIYPENSGQDIDVLISVSGPEPARTLFEKIILSQIEKMEGKIVVTLGKPERSGQFEKIGNAIIYSHINRKKMNEYMNRAKLIICRSGYSTIMELLSLRKKAILIPTPGQTEQEYLAAHLKELNLFHSLEQRDLDLPSEINQGLKILTSQLPDIQINDTRTFLKYLHHR